MKRLVWMLYAAFLIWVAGGLGLFGNTYRDIARELDAQRERARQRREQAMQPVDRSVYPGNFVWWEQANGNPTHQPAELIALVTLEHTALAVLRTPDGEIHQAEIERFSVESQKKLHREWARILKSLDDRDAERTYASNRTSKEYEKRIRDLEERNDYLEGERWREEQRRRIENMGGKVLSP